MNQEREGANRRRPLGRASGLDSPGAYAPMARLATWLVLGLLALVALPVRATGSLNIEPITWNVIGLDSNNVNVGPNDFPVGARACRPYLTTWRGCRCCF